VGGGKGRDRRGGKERGGEVKIHPPQINSGFAPDRV